MKRLVPALIIGLITCLITVLFTGLAAPAPARADVIAVSLPTQVTISARTLILSGSVRVASSSDGVRSASLWFRYPDANHPGASDATRVGSATSRRHPGFLMISARLDATRLVPGLNQLLVIDAEDGGSRLITLDLRRESRARILRAVYRSSQVRAGANWSKGTMALTVRVAHFDPKTDALIPSRLSPVRLQESVNGTWVTLARATTDRLGLARALVPSGPGVHLYRAVRPDGATVRAATSLTVRAGQGIVASTLTAG